MRWGVKVHQIDTLTHSQMLTAKQNHLVQNRLSFYGDCLQVNAGCIRIVVQISRILDFDCHQI